MLILGRFASSIDNKLFCYKTKYWPKQICNRPEEVNKLDLFKMISDEDLPMYYKTSVKYNLFVYFNVNYPDSLNKDKARAIMLVRPPKPAH